MKGRGKQRSKWVKLQWLALLGGGIGFCTGIFLFLSLSFILPKFPSLGQLAEFAGNLAETPTELGIRLICGQSPNIGCASGLGMLIFFVIWPLIFCLILLLLGVILGLAFAGLYRWWKMMSRRKTH
jgi:hypothetical protein